jgi:hypothetical protein
MKKVAPPTTRTGLAVRWVPVSEDHGRVRMEMRWSAPPALARRPA